MSIDFVEEAVLPLSNFGGVSIMLDPLDNDFIYYRYYHSDPVRVEMYHVTCEETKENVLAFSIEEQEYRLDEFMRVGI